MGFGGEIGADPDSVIKASNSSSSKLHIASRGAGERIRARASGAEGLSRGLDLPEVDDEGIDAHSVEDVEKYGEEVDARLSGAEGCLSEEVGLEDETRVDEVEAGVEVDFVAARVKLDFGTAVGKVFVRTAGGAALVDVELSGGLPTDGLLTTGDGTLTGGGACGGASASPVGCGSGSGSACPSLRLKLRRNISSCITSWSSV